MREILNGIANLFLKTSPIWGMRHDSKHFMSSRLQWNKSRRLKVKLSAMHVPSVSAHLRAATQRPICSKPHLSSIGSLLDAVWLRFYPVEDVRLKRIKSAMKPEYSRKGIVSVTRPFRIKSQERAAALFAQDVILYVVLFSLTLYLSSWVLKTLASVALGVVIARLFILGHDCCHGSFFPSPLLNSVAGRIAFLPSLTPFSLWEVGHNVVHHSFPNLKGRDYVWAPLSKQDFDRLSFHHKLLERFYRSAPGLGFYYLLEIWWKRLIFPSRAQMKARRRIHLQDNLFVVSYALVTVLAICMGARRHGEPLVTAVCFSTLLPFAVWNYLIGFVTYVHHTHPQVAWYDNKDLWRRALPQIRNTVHVTFPVPFSAVLHNIMEHNAHHADINVPLYELPNAQTMLESTLDGDVVIQRWSLAQFRDCLRVCKLYDCEDQCWQDFKGNITACTGQSPAVSHVNDQLASAG